MTKLLEMEYQKPDGIRMHEDLQKCRCFVSCNGEESHYSQMNQGKCDL
jgi:hypothetical protein